MNKTTLPSELKSRIYDMETKTVRKGGNAGAVYLPKEWIGKKVQVLLIEPVNQKGD